MPSERLRGLACFRSYWSIRLPGEPELDESSRVLNRRRSSCRPREVSPDEMDTASLSSGGTERGSLAPAGRRPKAGSLCAGSPCCEREAESWGESTEVAVWEASVGADCI